MKLPAANILSARLALKLILGLFLIMRDIPDDNKESVAAYVTKVRIQYMCIC